MSDVKSATIVPIGIYCLLLGVFALSMAINALLDTKTVFTATNFVLWIPLIAYSVFASCLFILGIGILQVNNLCWKIFFFFLVICVSSVATLILVFIILFFVNANSIFTFFQAANFSSLQWFAFLSFFLSEIIVLYYLASDEVVTAFGGMGELISPF